MAEITTNQVVAGLKKGSTFGTEGDITSAGIYLYASRITVNGGFGDFRPRDVGLAGKKTSIARLAFNATVQVVCDLTYGQGWLALFAGLMGTESTPTEITGGQTDYSINIDLADTADIYWTLGYSIEDDRTISIYSLKINSATIQLDINSPGTVTFSGIADRVVEGSANTVAEISALTKYAYESVTLGGANHYFRIDAYSAGTALTNADDKTIQGVTISLSRPYQPRFGLRAANTPYTMNPLQLGDIQGALTVRHVGLDNATYDMLTQYTAKSALMAEFFYDGAQIGSGVNSSNKWQFPLLNPMGQFPRGHDLAGNNQYFNTEITYEMLKTTAAPAGMSGVTDYLRLVDIHRTRSTKWTA